MGRRAVPFTLAHRPGSPSWYYKLGLGDTYRTTGTKVRGEAMKIAMLAAEEASAGQSDRPLRAYADQYFIWSTCPHVRGLTSEGKSINHYHVKNMRSVLENHVFTDPISRQRISEIKRADILDLWERLVEAMCYTRTVQRAVTVLKIVLKEAFFRKEINRDPTAGVGVTKYQAAEIGTFTAEELRALFPAKPPGPWKNLAGYAVFLTAATTGMRRGEILGLTWECLDFEEGSIEVRQAWKDRHELGPPKWNKLRTVPMPSRLAEILKQLRRRKHHTEAVDLVFCYPHGSRFGGTWWAKRFNAAMKVVKIDRQGRNLRPHSFRHTLNSLLRENGYDPARIRSALGWSDESIQDNYTHWSVESLISHRETVDGLFR